VYHLTWAAGALKFGAPPSPMELPWPTICPKQGTAPTAAPLCKAGPVIKQLSDVAAAPGVGRRIFLLGSDHQQAIPNLDPRSGDLSPNRLATAASNSAPDLCQLQIKSASQQPCPTTIKRGVAHSSTGSSISADPRPARSSSIGGPPTIDRTARQSRYPIAPTSPISMVTPKIGTQQDRQSSIDRVSKPWQTHHAPTWIRRNQLQAATAPSIHLQAPTIKLQRPLISIMQTVSNQAGGQQESVILPRAHKRRQAMADADPAVTPATIRSGQIQTVAHDPAVSCVSS
ncbi:hypothetical protein ACLOJK_022303, partial [Asimina triloba]